MKDIYSAVLFLLIFTAVGIIHLIPGSAPAVAPAAVSTVPDSGSQPMASSGPSPSPVTVAEVAPATNPDGYPDVLIFEHTRDMGRVIFSHSNHLRKATCDKCHEGSPPLFKMERRKQEYHMKEFFLGKGCGFCHTSNAKVAFSSQDCNQCHTKN